MARSVVLATRGEVDKALAMLESAFNIRPHTNSRVIFSYYQIIELTEFLYQMTGDSRFIDTGLNWAEGFRKIQPQISWAHAFVAKYSRNEKLRIEAAAYAGYLDPKSAWLKSVPQPILDLSASWWKKNTPFEKSKTKSRATPRNSVRPSEGGKV